MKTLKHNLILILLLIGFNAYSQDDASYKLLISKIDSISKDKGIELGEVKILTADEFIDYGYHRTTAALKKLFFRERQLEDPAVLSSEVF